MRLTLCAFGKPIVLTIQRKNARGNYLLFRITIMLIKSSKFMKKSTDLYKKLLSYMYRV